MTTLPAISLHRTGAVLRMVPEVTWRQLDYWQRVGAIAATQPSRGSGMYAGWSAMDIMRLRAIGRLQSLLVPAVARDISRDFVATLWRELDAHGVYDLWLGGGNGVRIHVELEEHP